MLEDPDAASWHFNPPAPAAERLIGLILDTFRAGGGDFEAGRSLRGHLVGLGIEPTLDAQVLVLPPGHPYLRLPLQFATSLTPRIEPVIGPDALASLRAAVEGELVDPVRWGTTFTLIQAYGRVPG